MTFKLTTKTKIFAITLFAVAGFLFASDAKAQSVAPGDMQTLAEKELATKNASGTSGYLAARNDLIQFCTGLGDRLSDVTENDYSTLFAPLSDTCVFGLRMSDPEAPADYLRSNGYRAYSVSLDNTGGAAGLQAHMIQRTSPMTPEDYEKSSFAVRQANQDSVEDETWYSELVGAVITAVFNILAEILLGIASLAAWILNWTTETITSARQPAIIAEGWKTVRDVVNLFFIASLIAIAIATILRIESYNYKKLLIKLILMALLVNFSKIIAETLIGIADMVTLLFSAQAGLKDWGSQFIGIITQNKGVVGFFGDGQGFTSALGTGVMKLVAAIIMTISFLAIAALMVVRLIGLWILIVISPVAYALNILPQTKDYAKKWWNTFFKYLIWAPVAMFFISLGRGLVVMKGNGTLTGDHIFDYILISAFIWAAIIVAKQAGMAGAAGIVNMAEKGLDRAKSAGKWTAGAAGSYTARGTVLSKNAGLGKIAGSMGYTGLATKLDKAGEKIGKATAYPQAKLKQVQEVLAIGNRRRDKQINDTAYEAIADSKVKLDKDMITKMSRKQLLKRLQRRAKDNDANYDEVSDILEYKGRAGAEVMMTALSDGLINGMNTTGKIEEADAIYRNSLKAYATSKGVKEHDFEADYATGVYGGRPRGGTAVNNIVVMSQVGSLKPGESWDSGPKPVRDEHWRKDNRQGTITIVRRGSTPPPTPTPVPATAAAPAPRPAPTAPAPTGPRGAGPAPTSGPPPPTV